MNTRNLDQISDFAKHHATMNANISHQIPELANCGNQEILMWEMTYKHNIKEFSKVEDERSFEFKTTNSLESPYRYVFKRRLKLSNSQSSVILITADFLNNELGLYEARKENLHHYLVFMYNDCMIEFNMKDIREWIMREGPNPKKAQVRNKKCKDGSFALCTEMVYYIPASVPRIEKNYILSEAARASIYNRWINPFDYSDAEPAKQPAQQATSISPYF